VAHELSVSSDVTEQTLRDAIAALADDEILALCYALKGSVPRLRLYADVLRQRGGSRAQFASCLICFDLARQGEESSQREFEMLAASMRTLCEKGDLVETLVGSDPYLTFIWELCQGALQQTDPLLAEGGMALGLSPPAPLPQEGLTELNLLDDTDFVDFRLASDDATLLRRFDDAVDVFIGAVAGIPMYERDKGFRLHNSRDVQRYETFLQALTSLREAVPAARAYRALVLLHYGSSLRSRTLFGGINQKKQAMLRDGVLEFMQAGAAMWQIVGVMGPLHSDPGLWEKLSTLLLDFAQWAKQSPEAALAGLDADAPGTLNAYEPIGRLGTKF
jgi:hypothetical protein